MDHVGAMVDSKVFCVQHTPRKQGSDDFLIFADSEWPQAIHCCVCGDPLSVVIQGE